MPIVAICRVFRKVGWNGPSHASRYRSKDSVLLSWNPNRPGLKPKLYHATSATGAMKNAAR